MSGRTQDIREQERDRAWMIVAKHKRHVEASPGVGREKQGYALAVLDDVMIDLRRADGHGEEDEDE